MPHWDQGRRVYFITFRLGDSLPVGFLEWLEIQGVDPIKKRKIIEKYMDAGKGACILRDQKNRKVLEDVLRRKNNQDYFIYAYAIMPNHVHILVEIFGDNLIKTVKFWKGASGARLKKLHPQMKKIWMSDCYDRIIRNMEHFSNCLEYIKNNPVKAYLRDSEYALYVAVQMGLSESG